MDQNQKTTQSIVRTRGTKRQLESAESLERVHVKNPRKDLHAQDCVDIGKIDLSNVK